MDTIQRCNHTCGSGVIANRGPFGRPGRVIIALLPFLALSLLLAATSSARAEEVAEPSSGEHFQTPRQYADKPHVLIGTGLFKKFFVNIYAMGFYVEQGNGKRAFQSLLSNLGDRPLDSDSARNFIATGQFGKLIVLKYLRDVDQKRLQGAYREHLEEALPKDAPPELQRDAESFLALFTDVRKGEELRIHSDANGKITVEIGGKKKDGPQNPQLARAIWEMWLGQKPISKDMRESLIERIHVLSK